MKRIIWMSGGAILVSAAFLIPAGQNYVNIWPSVIAGSIAALVYLLAFFAVWNKKITSNRKRKVIGAAWVVLVLCSTGSLLLWKQYDKLFSLNLKNVNSTYLTEYAKIRINEPLAWTLKDYYEAEEQDRDLGSLFLTRYGADITDDNQLLDKGSTEDLPRLSRIYVAKTNFDTVLIVGESELIEGMEQDFQNYSGETGLLQFQGLLTREGIDYERVN